MRPARTQDSDRLPAWLLVPMVAAIGLNLRASLGSVPPLIDHIKSDLGIADTAAGLLTSVPVVFMGLAAPLGQRLGARLGSEAAVGWMMLILGVAGLLRLAPSGAPMLYGSAALAGAAMGGISALMPALIAFHLPSIRGLATGIYSTGLAMGVAIAAGTAVPLEYMLDGWRPALAVWGAFATATAVWWVLLSRRMRSAPRAAAPDVVDRRLPWRDPVAWSVTLFVSSQMIVGFSGLAWITPFYLSLGLAPQHAANLLVLFQVVQLLSMLTLPTLTDHTTDRRPLLAGVVVSAIAGIAALLIAPLTLAIPAMALFGMGVGGGSTLGLVLIGDAARTHSDGARLGAMCLFVAFLTGALGPLVLGMLSDLTGDLRSGYAVMLALSALVLVLVTRIAPGRVITSAAARTGRAAATEHGR